jgi:hypothetical protein
MVPGRWRVAGATGPGGEEVRSRVPGPLLSVRRCRLERRDPPLVLAELALELGDTVDEPAAVALEHVADAIPLVVASLDLGTRR